jgi:hypothetical protein
VDKDLAELEKTMRYAAERDIRVLLRKDLATFIAEFDRRGLAEAGARAEIERLKGELANYVRWTAQKAFPTRGDLP